MGRAIMRRPNARIVLVRTNAPNGRPSIPPFALVWGVCVGAREKVHRPARRAQSREIHFAV